MGIKCVEQLLRENQAAKMRERRATNRKPFARPVKIVTAQNEIYDGFSRDLSPQGIGVITQEELPQSTIATITIHRLEGSAVDVPAEVRWSAPFGDGWYVSGWRFLV